jgi:hypothetical protein
MKIWLDEQLQTVAWEWPQLPGEVFKIVIPEIITETELTLIGWPEEPQNWEVGEDTARWSVEHEGVVKMEAEVLFGEEQVTAAVDLTNLSEEPWENVNVFTCFAFYAAPLFNDLELARTYFPTSRGWKSVAELWEEHYPGDGPYTFYPVAGGPDLDSMWISRRIDQRHPEVMTCGCGAAVSSDGEWVVGMSAAPAAYTFNNREWPCLHADPYLGTMQPGESKRGECYVHLLRGGLDELSALCATD